MWIRDNIVRAVSLTDLLRLRGRRRIRLARVHDVQDPAVGHDLRAVSCAGLRDRNVGDGALSFFINFHIKFTRVFTLS